MTGSLRQMALVTLSRSHLLLPLLTVIGLVGGLFLLLTASHPYSAVRYNGDPFAIVYKQVRAALVGLILFASCALMPAWVFRRMAIFFHLVTVVLLVRALFSPPFEHSEVHRWVKIQGLILQPSELAKVTLPIAVASFAHWAVTTRPLIKRWLLWGTVVLVVGGTFFLIALQPHLSGALIVGALGLLTLFFSGVSPGRVLFVCILCAGLFWTHRHTLLQPYQLKRIEAALNPDQMTEAGRYQQRQAQIALGVSGPFGRGLFQGRQKHLILPAAHNDFVFSAFGEEIGWIWCSVIILFYQILAYIGFVVAAHQPEPFGSGVAGALTCYLWMQSVLHILVNTGQFGVTGIPLPFVSAGGSSLCATLTAMGLLTNLARYAAAFVAHAERREIETRSGSFHLKLGVGWGRHRRSSLSGAGYR